VAVVDIEVGVDIVIGIVVVAEVEVRADIVVVVEAEVGVHILESVGQDLAVTEKISQNFEVIQS
jgi:hypothetical protein